MELGESQRAYDVEPLVDPVPRAEPEREPDEPVVAVPDAVEVAAA